MISKDAAFGTLGGKIDISISSKAFMMEINQRHL